MIEVYNKADLIEPQFIPIGENRIAISASSGVGLDKLLSMIDQKLDTGVRRLQLLLPYSAAGELDRLHREARVFLVEYENDGIRVDAALNREQQGRYREYIQ